MLTALALFHSSSLTAREKLKAESRGPRTQGGQKGNNLRLEEKAWEG